MQIQEHYVVLEFESTESFLGNGMVIFADSLEGLFTVLCVFDTEDGVRFIKTNFK